MSVEILQYKLTRLLQDFQPTHIRVTRAEDLNVGFTATVVSDAFEGYNEQTRQALVWTHLIKETLSSLKDDCKLTRDDYVTLRSLNLLTTEQDRAQRP